MNICTDIHDPKNPGSASLPDFVDPITRINNKLATNMDGWMINGDKFIDLLKIPPIKNLFKLNGRKLDASHFTVKSILNV